MARTKLHYQPLRLDPWSWLTIALFAAAILIRILLYFPLAAYQIDSDGVIAGLCAYRIAEHHLPVFFPGGFRLSAASCYLTAMYFHVVGPGRVGLALTGLTWGILYLAFTLLFLRAVLGRKLACVGFIFAAVPPEQYMTVTYVPWGYGEIMASCAATLWLAALWRGSAKLWQRLGFGVSVGLGIWFSLQTLMVTLPAILWIAQKRRRTLLDESLAPGVAALIGMLPFLIGNVTHGFPTFTQNWASRSVSGVPQFFDNFSWLLSYLLPKLLVRSSGWASETTLLIAAYAVVASGFIIAVSKTGRARHETGRVRELAWLVALVLLVSIAIFSSSNAGTIRAWTVRYIAPIYAIVPLFCALGLREVWRRSHWLAAAAIAALTIPNLFLYGLPGSGMRTELTQELRDDARLRRILAQRDVRMVYGNYVWVYHVNFDSQQRIAGIPFTPVVDYFGYGGALGTSPVRWAALGNPQEVAAWSRAARATGRTTAYRDLFLFIADRPARNAAGLLSSLRTSP